MLYALVCRFFCGEEWARSGSSCYPFDVVVISYPVNKKTTATNGGSFAGIQSYQLFLPKVTGYTRPQKPKLFFQCSLSKAHTSRPLVYQVTNGYRHWRIVVSVRVGLKTIVTLHGAVVGLNGGFVHTVQLGANCLPGTECQAWNEKTRP